MKRLLFKYTTFIKYIFFYLLILFISIIGLSCIVNVELKSKFTNSYQDQLRQNLQNYAVTLENQFFSIMQINYELSQNMELIESRYNTTSYQNYRAKKEISRMVHSNPLLKDIIYINTDSKTVLNDLWLAKEEQGTVKLMLPTAEEIIIPYEDYIQSGRYNQLIEISASKSSFMVYLPKQLSDNYVTVMLIDEAEIMAGLKALYLPTTTDIYLRDAETQVNMYSTASQSEEMPDGQQEVYQCNFPYVQIVALSDEQMVDKLIQKSFQKSYLLVGLLTVIGLIISVPYLLVTYLPLKKLSGVVTDIGHEILPKQETADVDLNYMGQVLKTISVENKALMKKVQNYRYSMQKSILSMAAMQEGELEVDAAQVDRIFECTEGRSFFILQFRLTEELTGYEILELFTDCLPQTTEWVLIEKKPLRLTYLISFYKDSIRSESALSEAFQTFMEQNSCKCIVSRTSDSLMDIARLYEDTLQDKAENLEAYPYHILDAIVSEIESLNFDKAEGIIHELFHVIGANRYPEFFIRCILLDKLTLMIGCINKNHLPFARFSEIYYELLYLCRSKKFSEYKQPIEDSFLKFLKLYKNEMAVLELTLPNVEQCIKEHCMDSSFSIVQLGDFFHVSGAYISYWFKKHADINFSEYLWEIRFQYAKQLMEESTLTIKEISEKIGYDNYSSFRRKFKDATGISPVEFRAKLKTPSRSNG